MLSKIQKVAVSGTHTEVNDFLAENGFSDIMSISNIIIPSFLHPSSGSVFYRKSDLEDYIFDHVHGIYKAVVNPFHPQLVSVSATTEIRIVFPSLAIIGSLTAYAGVGINKKLFASENTETNMKAYIENKLRKELSKYICGAINKVLKSDIFLVKPQFFRDTTTFQGKTVLTIVIL